jgi:hypothetical protein
VRAAKASRIAIRNVWTCKNIYDIITKETGGIYHGNNILISFLSLQLYLKNVVCFTVNL